MHTIKGWSPVNSIYSYVQCSFAAMSVSHEMITNNIFSYSSDWLQTALQQVCSYTFCYADDIVLLAPCASALRIMLSICNSYAVSHGLEFNASKTQLICFRTPPTRPCVASIYFGNIRLQYSKQAKLLIWVIYSHAIWVILKMLLELPRTWIGRPILSYTLLDQSIRLWNVF